MKKIKRLIKEILRSFDLYEDDLLRRVCFYFVLLKVFPRGVGFLSNFVYYTLVLNYFVLDFKLLKRIFKSVILIFKTIHDKFSLDLKLEEPFKESEVINGR